jgi:hypothetical protein
MSPLREIFEAQYKAAAAEGALYELRLRLLADKVAGLRSFSDRLEGRLSAHGPRLPRSGPPRMGPLTGEHLPRIREPGRWSARPSLTQSRTFGELQSDPLLR